MTNFDDFKLAVESLSGGHNTVLLDDLGMPSVVVPFPKLNYSDVFEGGAQEPLPAFVVDGQEKQVVYISKYLNVIVNDRAYSLPMKDPAASLNFDRALTVCRNKGAGWHLNTNAMFAAIAAWCKKNGTMPHGNNNYGADIGHPHEKGVPSSPLDSEGRACRTATGSGPSTWYHNYDMSGIADLNGDVWEWVSGLRIVDGEIQIIPYTKGNNPLTILASADEPQGAKILLSEIGYCKIFLPCRPRGFRTDFAAENQGRTAC